jgi:hypothetical protein
MVNLIHLNSGKLGVDYLTDLNWVNAIHFRVLFYLPDKYQVNSIHFRVLIYVSDKYQVNSIHFRVLFPFRQVPGKFNSF